MLGNAGTLPAVARLTLGASAATTPVRVPLLSTVAAVVVPS